VELVLFHVSIACGTNHEGLGPLQDGEVVDFEIRGATGPGNPNRRSMRWPVCPTRWSR
jgi:hypothetical protein